ncbi:hypothetical protein ACO0K0_01530 [Undibacterium sp. SXout11W]|uniref:hypothetical protein n=1 Tax=Undibacterium sp. SXout11W TaxID=3413050 RepID=UPI003BF2D392
MAGDKKVIRNVCQVGRAEILPFLQTAAKFCGEIDPENEKESILKNCLHFVVYEDEKPLFGYSLEVGRTEIFITQAAGKADFDIVDHGLQIIESQARGFKSVAFQTIRRGLVRKAKKYGYLQDGKILRKWL